MYALRIMGWHAGYLNSCFQYQQTCTGEKWIAFRCILILPEIFAVVVIGLADAVRFKDICAPIVPVLFPEGILLGRHLHMEQLAFNPVDRRLKGKRNSANKEQQHEDIYAWHGLFPGRTTRFTHDFYLSVCPLLA